MLNTYSAAGAGPDPPGVRRGAVRRAASPTASSASASREPFTRSARLVDLVRDAIPAATRRTGGNPAKRTFQALRIEVNDELGVLRRALPAAIDALGVGGRVVVMSYHSLEDRITKQALRPGQPDQPDVPPDLPVVPEEHQPVLRLLTRGAETADEAEVAENPRARSVRVRAAERVREGPSHDARPPAHDEHADGRDQRR